MTRDRIRNALLAACFVSCLAIGACNTVEGAGEDISATGKAISGASENVQEDLSGD